MNDVVENYVIPQRAIDERIAHEQATLIVDDIDFRDWESVSVSIKWADAFAHFRFTSVERDTPPGLYYKLQFVPGARVKVNLGGVNVLIGYIETRQVAYDANRHGIELIGKSITAPVARSSVHTKSGSFDGMTWKQVADKVVNPHGLKVIPIGTLNATPFAKLQNQPGEFIWDFLERIARPRGIILGSDSFGNFLAIGPHHMPVINTQLIEGENIKKCQMVMHKKHYAEYISIAQGAASDANHGRDMSEMKASWAGTGYPGSVLITPAEQPVKAIQEVLDRAKNEAIWNEGPKLEVTIVVQGWFRDDVNLWWPGDNVFLYSPMCPLNQMMKIEQVTFSQDNSNGTETTLLLKQPWALLDIAIDVSPVSPTNPAFVGPVQPGKEVPPVP